jgi:hypothetical protein
MRLAACRADIEGAFANLFDGADACQGKKKPKWSGKSAKAQAIVSPVVRSSASKLTPSVVRMKRALAEVVFGLRLSAARARAVSPSRHVAI